MVNLNYNFFGYCNLKKIRLPGIHTLTILGGHYNWSVFTVIKGHESHYLFKLRVPIS